MVFLYVGVSLLCAVCSTLDERQVKRIVKRGAVDSQPAPHLPPGLGQPELERITKFMTAEWYLDRQLMVLVLTGISREGTDVFAKTGLEYFGRRFTANLPVFYMLEIRADLTLTPYFRQRAEENIGQYRGVTGRAAYLFEGNVLLRVAKPLILILQHRMWPAVTVQTFKDKPAALTWLYDGWRLAQSAAIASNDQDALGG